METAHKENHLIDFVHVLMDVASYMPLIHTNHNSLSMISVAMVSLHQIHYKYQSIIPYKGITTDSTAGNNDA